jgi:hypothetical protein
MVTTRLHDAGLRSSHLHLASLASIGLCITLWIRAKTVDQDERGNAERRALFVGLWPPMFWLIGDSLRRPPGTRRATCSMYPSRLRGLWSQRGRVGVVPRTGW